MMRTIASFSVFVILITGLTGQHHPRPAKHKDIKRSVSQGSKIIGGVTSLPHQWPFIASIQYNDGYHFCGGALIADKWVLTAAHCTEGFARPGDFRVVLGEHTLGVAESNEQIINVSVIHNNPFYNLQAPEHQFYLPYDLSLLELSSRAQLNSYVQTINLPSSCESYEYQTCKIIGWGRMNRTSKQTTYLQEGNVNVIPIGDCRAVWGGYVYYGCTCVFAWGTSACQGDSGGPLACLTPNGYSLAGVSSWGDVDCGDYPSIYTQVAEHVGWIRDIMTFHGST